MMSDPISDFLTRIRNAIIARKETVESPSSKMKKRIAEILEEEGFIKDWHAAKDEQGHDVLRLTLKYNNDQENQIRGLERISRPGRRQYVGKKDVPEILGGIGVAILTTSRGVLTGRQARDMGVGGEVVCKVW